MSKYYKATFSKTEWEDDTCRVSKDGSTFRLTMGEVEILFDILVQPYKNATVINTLVEEIWDEVYDEGRMLSDE